MQMLILANCNSHAPVKQQVHSQDNSFQALVVRHQMTPLNVTVGCWTGCPVHPRNDLIQIECFHKAISICEDQTIKLQAYCLRILLSFYYQ